ncbi:hypothetical protein O0L34_g3649 [Tuta absoluta]|nr:hypothetical protein O0L34_g3649 [Tuta absoluta]
MKTPMSSPVPECSKNRGGKNLSVSFQNLVQSDSDSDNSDIEQNQEGLHEFLQLRHQNENMSTLQTTIDLVQKEQMLDIGEQTQAQVDEMEHRVDQEIRSKGKKPQKVKQPKKKSLDQMPDPEPDSFLGVLELMWTINVYSRILTILKSGEQQAMKNKDLQMKREFMKLISLWKTILKLIVHKLRETKFDDLSWNAFRTILYDSELYTTCLSFKMSHTTIEVFHKYVNNEEKVASSGSATTPMITSMSSTTAPTPAILVDASVSNKSEMPAETHDSIEEFFGVHKSLASTGSISQYIMKPMNGVHYILRSPGEFGHSVV